MSTTYLSILKHQYLDNAYYLVPPNEDKSNEQHIPLVFMVKI